jgi:large subunit ribosomal protein L18
MKGIGRTIRRRRLEAKTDYVARLNLLNSFKPRVVVRKTNKYIIAQIVNSDIAQDTVIVGVSSKDLISHGWPESLSGSLKSLAAAYLTGLLLAKKSHIREAILDMGMQRNAKKGRIYALLGGLAAGGLSVPHSQDIVPDEKRLLENKRTREVFTQLKHKLAHGGKGN